MSCQSVSIALPGSIPIDKRGITLRQIPFFPEQEIDNRADTSL